MCFSNLSYEFDRYKNHRGWWNLMARPLIKIVEVTIKEYNKYRYPESIAKLVSFEKKTIKIEFSGPFCYTCGFYDYFDDFIIFLEKKGIHVGLVKIKETNDSVIIPFSMRSWDDANSAEILR